MLSTFRHNGAVSKPDRLPHADALLYPAREKQLPKQRPRPMQDTKYDTTNRATLFVMLRPPIKHQTPLYTASTTVQAGRLPVGGFRTTSVQHLIPHHTPL